jgi:hypothetical protein
MQALQLLELHRVRVLAPSVLEEPPAAAVLVALVSVLVAAPDGVALDLLALRLAARPQHFRQPAVVQEEHPADLAAAVPTPLHLHRVTLS